MTLPSSLAPLPARTQRTRPVTNNGKAFPQYYLASVRSFVTSSDVCLPISSSQSRTCKTKHTTSSSDMFFIIYTLSFTITTCACRMTTHDCTLIGIPNVTLFFTSKHATRMSPRTDDDVRRNVKLGTLLERGLAVGWAV